MEWKRLSVDEIRSLHRSLNIAVVLVIKSRRLRLVGHVANMEEVRSAFKIITFKHTRNRPLGRPRRWRKNYLRMDLKEISQYEKLG